MAGKKTDYFEALYQVAKVVNSSLDPKKVLGQIVTSVSQALGAKACAIRLLDPRRKELIMGAAHGLSQGYLRKGKVLVEKSGLDKDALHGGAVCLMDAQNDPAFQYGARAKSEGIRSICVLPLKAGRKAIGVIRVYSDKKREWTDQEVRFLEAAANLSAIALDNARLHRALKTDYNLLVAHEYRLDDN
ncbi:MAG: GAF domain-containing protein [Desulfarculaceae bacterium]|nr:GAF domain-containing protein [Desulfarculaceae bacterium]MCF8071599.1 GAF domain-containing protein [Desulfarculaceae bacterium]MCF8103204.1 GAF domain-containing protein [Desulfarculaceae bacterium]MCF8114878.1 GAF domain-containing protein [Desulfarculaceae bacterium]